MTTHKVSLHLSAWKAFASFVGSDLAINYIAGKVAGNSQQRKEVAMEVCISKGVFGSNTNVFSGFRGQANKINASQDSYINNVNSKLKNKFYVPNPKYSFMALTKPIIPAFQFTLPTNKRDDPKYKNVPMIVAPGKEYQYLADKAKYDAAQKKAAEKPKAETTETAKQTETEDKPTQQTQTEQPLQTNSNGWMDMLANATGLNGFGDTFSNMKECTLTIGENGKATLSADNGTTKVSRELTSAELSRLSAVLSNSELSDEAKKIRVTGLVNTIILSQQASQNYNEAVSRQENQQQNIQR